MSEPLLTYTKGDLFTAPSPAILVHACNAVGSWGSGIALTFRSKYPEQFKLYKAHCAAHPNKDDLMGTCLLLEVDTGDAAGESDPGHAAGMAIACLFTSKMYGKRKDSQESILENTRNAVADLLQQNQIHRPLHACRFNSGKFGVPWEKTASILEELGAEMTVYEPLSEEA